ncbi:MAG: glycosyltransferase family 4 protein [Sphingobium sp.]|jgi:glycosyltransferase involved in cell wall biosynthesis|nr:glycosyltransferase family 4 protein [Sphingobium sp.]MCI1271585.1 glycosyltransferase family 4 protein [Sphingobium sp.]MCI1754823.1 glycosyltransferase family 4 protein [Sphingobium sp.]MCI2053675.1 glycosyltransferase family 4 protein [Sphingobium sp.]
MIYLFIHQNFPGQYKHLIRHLADDPENTVYFISQPNPNWMQGVIKLVYYPDLASPIQCHRYTVDFEVAVRHGEAVAKSLGMLRAQGVTPDIIIGHSGWGETLFVKDVYPDTPLLSYFEFFYHHAGADADFDPEFPGGPDDSGRLRMRNAVNLLSFESTDWGNAPTRWQRSLYPPEMRPRISVLHEGIDTDAIKPDANAWLQIERGNLRLTAQDEVVTYVARNLEPYRGFHIFMRAIPEIQRLRPNAHILVVGGDEVSYGCPLPSGQTYRQKMLAEMGNSIDTSKVHFLGQLPYETYLSVLQISSAHIYLTYPFVLSWSFLEAMSAGCAMIGSATAPVEEVIRDGENGLLVDFFSPRAIAETVDHALSDSRQMREMRENARATVVEHYDLRTRILPQWQSLMADLVMGRRPQLAEAPPRASMVPPPAAPQRRAPPVSKATGPRKAPRASDARQTAPVG